MEVIHHRKILDLPRALDQVNKICVKVDHFALIFHHALHSVRLLHCKPYD